MPVPVSKLLKTIWGERESVSRIRPLTPEEQQAGGRIEFPGQPSDTLDNAQPQMREATEPQTPQEPSQAPFEPEPPRSDAQVEREAQGIAGAKLDDFDPDDPWQTNFSTITSPDDIKATIARQAESQKDQIQEARRGVITDTELKGLAEDLGGDVEVVRRVMQRETGTTLKPEEVLAARQTLNRSAEVLKSMADIVARGDANDHQKFQFFRQMQIHNAFQAQFMGARAEAGRILRAYGIPIGTDDLKLKRITEVMDTVMHPHDINKLATAIANSDTVAGINRVARETRASKVSNLVAELYITSILSGPTTHLVNFFGGTMFQGMNIAEHYLAEKIGRFTASDAELAAKHGIKLDDDPIEPGESAALLFGTLSAYQDAWNLMKKSFVAGEPLDRMEKADLGPRAITGEYLGIGGAPGKAVDWYGNFHRFWTDRVMVPADEFNKALAWRGSMAAQAYKRAAREAKDKGLGEAEFLELLRKYINSPIQQMDELANDYAYRMAFQTPLGPLGRSLQKTLKATGIGALIQPFVRTPGNILKEGLVERGPLGIRSDAIRGVKGKRERDLAITRQILGNTTAALTVAWVASGKVTGGGPSDHMSQKWLRETHGWQPYSIKVGDKYHSYLRGEPASVGISAIADITEMMMYLMAGDPYEDLEGTPIFDAAGLVAGGISSAILSRTFMTGIMDFVEANSDPDRYMASYLEGIATSALPWSSFRRYASKMDDPVMREAWNTVDKLKRTAGIPGYSENLAPRLDIFGDPIHHPTGEFLGPYAVVKSKKIKTDPLRDELMMLFNIVKKVPVGYMSRNIEGMPLEEDEYYRAVLLSRKELKNSAGRTFLQELEHTINSRTYNRPGKGWDEKFKMVKDVQTDFDTMAQAIMAQDPVIKDRLMQIEERRKMFFQ